MVRASRNASNASNARRADRVLGAESMPPGYERTPAHRAALAAQDRADRAAARMTEAQRAQAPQAAKLDKFPWAASFGSFIAAIRDPSDPQGARSAISAVRNQMGEAQPSEGGFLVPWGLQQRILALMTTAIVRPRATCIPVAGLRESVPFLENADQSTAGQALAGLKFGLIEEGATWPATNPRFGRTTLEVNKIGAYIQNVPNELLADSPAFTEVFLPTTIARGLAFFEDDLFVASGSGVGQPEALANAPAAVTVTRANSGEAPVHADIIALAQALHPESWTAACWLLSADAFSALLELYLNPTGGSAAGIVPPSEWLVYNPTLGYWTLLGIPAFPNDHQNATGSPADVMLCELDLYLVADRGEMTVEVSSKGAGFTSDTSNIRIRHRVDGRFWPRSPYTTKASQSVSPLVVLQ